MEYEISELVNQLLSSDWEDIRDASEGLITYGEEAIPALVDAIYDDRFDIRHPGAHFAQPSPIEAVVSVLLSVAVEGTARHVVHCLSRESIPATEVARSLGTMACDDCIVPLASLLVEDEHRIREAACNGIVFGTKRPHCSQRFKSELYPHVVQRIEDTSWAVRALIALNRDRAAELLNTAEYLTGDFPFVYDLLRGLKGANASIDHELLFRLRADLRDQVEGRRPVTVCGSSSITYSVVMKSLAKNGADVSREIVETIDLEKPRDSIVYIQALEFLGDDVLSLLQKLSHDDNELVASTARQILAKRGRDT